MSSLTANALSSTTLDEHQDSSQREQRRADRWLLLGTGLLGTGVLGPLGLIPFFRGLHLLRSAERSGLSVRPMVVTLIGYCVFIDGAINTIGWIADLLASHNLVWRVFMMGWGHLIDNGYFWHYNELGIGGSGAPGEKSWIIVCCFVVFPMRMAACVGFLQMKRWGHQWLIVTCWFGVVAWFGYITNMTIYADLRFQNTAFPVIGWWMYDIFYITPFIALLYLHTVNREAFAD